MANKHHELNSIHFGAFVQDADPVTTDPDVVRAKILWIDTTGPTLKYRNLANTGWVTVSGGGDPDGTILVGGDSIDVGGDTLVTGA
jgi:hypothetical protein